MNSYRREANALRENMFRFTEWMAESDWEYEKEHEWVLNRWYTEFTSKTTEELYQIYLQG